MSPSVVVVLAVPRSRDKARQRAPAVGLAPDAGTIEVGRVARPHGVRGELRVALHWPGSDSLLSADEVLLEPPGAGARAVKVEAARRADRAILLKLAGIDDRDAAAELRGASVSVSRAVLPEPSEGEFYLCDLVGLRVVDPGGDVGIVVEIRSHPSVDCLVIRSEDGRLLEQPLVVPWLEGVDLTAGLVYLSGRDGLVE